MAYTRDWSEATPTNDNYGYEIDNFIVGVRVDVAERLEGMFEGFNTGETDVGINIGLFREQASIDTPAENKIALAAKASDDSKCELFWKDEDGDERQLTEGGQLLLGKSTTPYPILHNTTEEDGDGGRESRIVAKGEQSGGEVTTLGYIEFAHDGTSDDQKGRFRIVLNDGDDSDAPSKVAIEFASAGDIDVANSVAVLDEDDMVSDSATQLATQQSIKKYTDDQIKAKSQVVEATPSTTNVVLTTSYQVICTLDITTVGGTLIVEAVIGLAAGGGAQSGDIKVCYDDGTEHDIKEFADLSISTSNNTIPIKTKQAGLNAGTYTVTLQARENAGSALTSYGTICPAQLLVMEIP